MNKRTITLYAHESVAIREGRQTQLRRIVDASTCTVLGYPGKDMWEHLRWDREDRIVKDGGKGTCHMFCTTGYEYLHVPACHPEDDWNVVQTLYRVRPIWEPGDVLVAHRGIRLEVTGVRVQRLCEISDEDAEAEGCQGGKLNDGFTAVDIGGGFTIESMGTLCSASGKFLLLWESIYGEGSSDLNPWVWVIEFKRIDTQP